MAIALFSGALFRGTSLPPREIFPGGKPLPELCLDVNRASETELTALPGVGAATAERIVGHRRARGPYLRIDDLLEVKGIGPAKLALFSPLICDPLGGVSGSGE